MKTDCFYRVFATSDFEQKDKIERDDIIYVVQKSEYVKSDMYFDKNSEKWLCFDISKDKNVFEYAESAYLKPLSDSILKDSSCNCLEDYSPEQVRFFLEHRTNAKRYKFSKKNFFDERGLKKNLFSFEVISDFENLKVSLVAFFFNDVPCPVESNAFNPKIDEESIVFDMKGGEIFFKEKEVYPFMIEDELGNVPPNVAKKVFERVRECAQIFTGIKIEETRFAEPKDILIDAFNLTKIPFEKNLYPVLTSEYFEDEKFIVDRRESNIYNKFCKSVRIRSYRMLRKSYMERPLSLVTYHKVKRCGFSDVNIFNKILFDRVLSFVFDELYIEALCFFCKKFLKKKNELSLLNVLRKFADEKGGIHIHYEVRDSLNMFRLYYRYVPKELKTAILSEGMTTFNHDALSEISYKVNHKNRKFSYSKAQKSLEDKIDGYEFCLPADTNELVSVGVEMRNCVASYADDVLKKECTIVYAKKNGKRCLCIEIRGKTVCQERAVRNQRPDGEEEKALISYHARHSLAVD